MAQLSLLATMSGGVLIALLIIAVSARRAGVWRRVAHPDTKRSSRRRGPAHHQAKRTNQRRRVVRISLGVVGALLLIAGGFETFRLTEAYAQLTRGAGLERDAAQALGTDPGNWTSNNIATAHNLQQESQIDLEKADKTLRDDPVLKLASGIPAVGSQVSTALDLADITLAGSQAVGDFVQVAQAVDASRSSTETTGPRLIHLILQAQGPWTDADNRLGSRLDRLRSDQSRHLLPPLAKETQSAISILSPIAEEARIGNLAAQFAPAALGAGHSKNYLVIMANPSEMRPAGGFSGAIGTVTMDNGAPSKIDIKNQEVFNPQIKTPTPVPYPMGRYMSFFKNNLELGDVGWDPDFPTTAKLGEQMYNSATGTSVDGTVSIDPWAIEALLKVTGPVDVPGYGTFNSDDFFPKLNYIVNVSQAPGSGKGALGPISQEVLKKILTQPASQFPRLASTFQQQAQTRHILAYTHDPALAQAAANVHFDGALVPGQPDYLLVADGNLGSNKQDFYLNKSLDLKTEVAPSGIVRHQVSVTYNNPAPVDDIDRALNPQGGYNDYVRFYLPETATVAGFSMTIDGKPGDGGIDRIAIEHGRATVGTFLRLPRGQQAVLTLLYEVPVAPGGSYSFFLQKQAGQLKMPSTIQVSYPGGVTSRTSDLTRDETVALSW